MQRRKKEMSDPSSMYNTLLVIFFILIIILAALVIYYFMLKSKQKEEETVKVKNTDPETGMEKKEVAESTLRATTYTKKSVFDFMEFDDVDDNMIIQKNEKRFLMVLECQGVNYDLMSNNEKIAVEEGFLQFLNTLRSSIQIYIQTRAVNLTQSISNYKERVDAVGRELDMKEHQLKGKRESGLYEEEELDKEAFEIVKLRNLYTYGKDIIFNTEQMSLNKNILTKRYYVIVPYNLESNGELLGKEEVRNIAFAELYTKSRSIMSALAACEVKSNILNTLELVELLYEAYNRDEAEIFNAENSIMSGFSASNLTASETVIKKMKELDKEIDEKAIQTANRAILQAKSELERKYDNKKKNLEDLIEESALRILEENKTFVGPKTAEVAQEKIREQRDERKEEQRRKLERKRELLKKKKARKSGDDDEKD